jgi:predicted N-acetyltransferase YhbS
VSELRPVGPLDSKRHHVKEFQCGQPSLDRWLQAYAGQSQRRDVARTCVAVDSELKVRGYYTLVAGQVEHAVASTPVRAGVARHFPIPICLIARLAVDQAWQGRGLGSDLLRDALRRSLAAADQVGIRAVLVDAIDDRAAAFYRRYGFEPASEAGLTLMVPIAAVRSQLSRSPRPSD